MKIQYKITISKDQLIGILNAHAVSLKIREIIPQDAEIRVDFDGGCQIATVDEQAPLEIIWEK